ncbi:MULTISPECIES: hypothetical protein [Bradyrhizobium]|uniref:hypothetical protein n=1 Tax=Bradyrhizobium TaxID=374 RepID=UPI00188A0ED2|nr:MULTISPECIES: hypothetical protein [Bradyrhizobium]MCC8939861.1 hypothetical protein [Bradyrhizobium ivorense]QOZ26808.1 hypothetical protein XH93_26750 [Bradyrhizobium sp. CCBAU 51753]
MRLNAAILMAALVVSGTVLAQSSGPSAGPVLAGQGANQGANVTTTGQAQNSNKKTGDSGPPIEQAARPAKPDAGGSTVGANRPKPDRRNEHYP